MKINRLNNILLGSLLMFIVSLSSCSDFLKVTPTGETDTPTALSDIRGLRSAMAGTYYKMFTFYSSDYYVYPDLAANTISLSTAPSSTRAREIYDYVYKPFVTGYWGTIYENLVNINNIIEYQPAVLRSTPNHKAELESIKAQALFLRALSHFELTKIYGRPYNCTATGTNDLSVPIVLRAPQYSVKPKRNTVHEVYAQIIKDLEEAIVLFGNVSIDKQVNGKYTANREAAYALLSRVYLYMEDWQNVVKYATPVIDKVPLASPKDYVNMYREFEMGDSEIIFRLNGALNKSNSLRTLFNLTYKAVEPDKAPIPVAPSAQVDTYLLGLFSPESQKDDIRFNNIIEKVEMNDGKGVFYVTNKFRTTNTDTEYEHFNPILLRSSEMYLNRAEAYLNMDELSKAAADIKQIIARARAKKVEDIVLAENDKENLRRVIENERIKELSFEGHQLYDILRKKQNMVRSKSTNSKYQVVPYWSHKFLQPIPEREVQINDNMQQNPKDPDSN